MGVVVSSHATLNEFSFTTGIIGVVSFAFTLGTFIRVLVMRKAPSVLERELIAE